MTCKAIIFDLDGVLIDSEAVFERHWRRWAGENGVEFERIAAVHHGIPPARTIGIVAPHMDAEDAARKYVERCIGDVEGVEAIDGARELLQLIPADRWAIATSSFRPIVLPSLARLGLPEPAVLVTTEDVTEGKPAPEPYLKAAQLLGFNPSECIVIEDAPAGIQSAKAAGAHVIAVTSTNPPEALQAADAIVSVLTDVQIHFDGSDIRVEIG